MSDEWTNLQIMECQCSDGSPITVIMQSNGNDYRYVLGNGTQVSPNPDGTFVIPQSADVLSVMAV